MALSVFAVCLSTLVVGFAVAVHVLPGDAAVDSWRVQLLANYSPSFGPLRFGKPLPVRVGFYIRHVPQVDLKTRHITVEVFFRMQWLDSKLLYEFDSAPPAWNDTEEYIPFMAGDIWEPNVVCSTCQFHGEPNFRNEGFYLYDRQSAEDRGYNVHWAQQGTIISGCKMDLSSFPFDQQTCLIRFESWKYTHQWLVIEPMPRFAERGRLFDEGSIEYEMEFAPRVQDSVYKAVTGVWPSIAFEISLKRRTHYYVVHAIAPMMLMVILSSGVFWMPLDATSQGSGERLSYAVTLMLTITATTLVTANYRPAVGYDTWLDRYQYYCVLFTCLPILETLVLFWVASIFGIAEEAQRQKVMTNRESEIGPSPAVAKSPSSRNLHRSSTFNILDQAHHLYRCLSSFGFGARWSLRDVDVAVRILNPLMQCIVFGVQFQKVSEEFRSALYNNVFGIIVVSLFVLALFGSVLSVLNRAARHFWRRRRNSGAKRDHVAERSGYVRNGDCDGNLIASDGTQGVVTQSAFLRSENGSVEIMRSDSGSVDSRPDPMHASVHPSALLAPAPSVQAI